ncbi:MAG: hypothetical protein H0X41_14045, partial [Chitinophagaceae bacterium]|nr:hypothetical protein [Chitinophagaceae bacterium]
RTQIYYYDSTGNLMDTVGFLPRAVYDNKVALYRTNKVWQFVNRNYSLNNSVAAVSYTASGLPVEFRPTGQTPRVPEFLGFTLFPARLDYTCSQ